MLTVVVVSLILAAAEAPSEPTSPVAPVATEAEPAPAAEPVPEAEPAPAAVVPEAAAPTPTPAPPAPTPLPTSAPATLTSPFRFMAGPLAITPRAQVRVRGEFVGDRNLRGGDVDAGGDPNKALVSERTRIGASLELAPMQLLIEIQDSRVWGGEKVAEGLPNDPTIFGQALGSVDLHQGFLGLHLGDVEARFGRQEISLQNERLIGLADFGNLGRAWDAIRVFTPRGATTWSAFGAVVQDRDAGAATDQFVAVVSAESAVTPWLRLSPIVEVEADLTGETWRTTLGSRVDGALGAFGYDVEIYGQPTRAPDGAVRAGGLAGARVNYGIDDVFLHPRLGVMTDVFTGTADATGATGALPFQSAFGTNHKFYGFQDLFTNLPLHTKNQGLIDTAATLWLKEGDFSAVAFVHVFMPFATADEAAIFGIEPDVVASWTFTKNLALEVGTAVFVPIGTALGRGESVAPWVYLQLNAALQ